MSINGKTVGLALSGGGYRASLFSLGSLCRLNDAALLPQIDRITSVSGGSILAGVLAHRWKQLRFAGGRAVNFDTEVMAPVQAFCSHTIDVELGLKGLLNPFKSAGDYLVGFYKKHLFGDTTMKQLATPTDGAPLFAFYATNLQTGRSFRFRQDKLADWKIGESTSLDVPLALAVAASSAFPPLFSPILLHSEVADWSGGALAGHDTLRQRIVLADGGIYDNMGLEQLMGGGTGSTDIVLVSDAGAPFEIEDEPHQDYVRQLGRVRDILIDQTRALRKRWLIDQFENHRRGGAYWGVTTKIGDYEAGTPLALDGAVTDALDEVPTRLAAFEPDLQRRLINWGYALCDAALRTKAGLVIPPAAGLPCPQSPLA
jgi:NTE family protein